MDRISLAQSLAAVSPSRIREIADMAFSMDGVLKLHFGESNLPTPAFIKEAAIRALDEGYTFYTEYAGLPGLRQAVAEKYHQLHGLRLDPCLEILINKFIVSHAPSMLQRAGETALRDGEEFVRGMVADVHRRVRFCYEALRHMKGVTVAPPEGSFNLFPRIAGLRNSLDFARSLLRENRVAVAPGSAFGKGGEGAVRICCAADESVLEPAMDRLGKFLERG